MSAEPFESDYDKSTVYHRMVEALKLAFSHFYNAGDPSFVTMESDLRRMETRRYAEALRQRIKYYEVSRDYYYSEQFRSRDFGGTSHVSSVDQNGDAVSLSCSINSEYV